MDESHRFVATKKSNKKTIQKEKYGKLFLIISDM